MKSQGRIMRVPDGFYNTVKNISLRDKKPMLKILDESAPIISNSDLLTRIWYGETSRRKRK